MKDIRLQRLALRDFQGGTFTLDAHGEDVFIFGQNTAGKTRIASAFSWLLFNKDALGRSEFEIKNLDAQGEAAHGLEHTVEADLNMDGEVVNLKKVYHEKWQKKRGSATAEFTGHTVEFSINGVPVQEKEYNARIAEIAGDESRFRLLTSPTAFPTLHWQKQRSLLLDVCGDLTDEEVIATDSRLADLKAILKGRKIDDHRKIVSARRAEINKELEKIPVRIDEVRRSRPDVSGLNHDSIAAEVDGLEVSINSKKLELQGVNAGGRIAELSKELAGINADIQKLESDHYSANMADANRMNQRISEASEKLRIAQRRDSELGSAIKLNNQRLSGLDGQLEALRGRWAEIDALQFKDTTETSCPTCGQGLPAERVQEAREKALAAFNLDKASKLEDVSNRGKRLREEYDLYEKQKQAAMNEQETLKAQIPVLEEEVRKLVSKRDQMKALAEDHTAIPAREDYQKRKAEIELLIDNERRGNYQDAAAIRNEITSLQSSLFAAKSKLDMFARSKDGEKRMEELKIIEKALAAEYERLESELYLTDLFIKTKVSLLTERINGKFEMVRFKLFNTLINGGLEDCCEITVGGVPFNAGLNNAARIQAGCDIIRTLQEHFGMRAPVIVDNRESVSEIPNMECQLISLVVSPRDRQLRVEVAHREAVAVR